MPWNNNKECGSKDGRMFANLNSTVRKNLIEVLRFVQKPKAFEGMIQVNNVIPVEGTIEVQF